MASHFLLILEFLFWFGWVVSTVLFSCLIIGLILELFLKKQIFSSNTARTQSYFNSLTMRLSSSLALISAALLIVTFINRYWLSRSMFGPWYFTDEIIEACINPFMLTKGENTWAGYTNYLTYAIYLMSYRLFGLGAQVARATNIFFFATSLAIFYWALYRPFGKEVGGFVVSMMLLSSPFITHSIYATPFTFCLLPAAITLWILTRPLTLGSAAFLGAVLVSGLYLFPAAFLTCVCLFFFHAVLFDPNWTWKPRVSFVASSALFGALTYYLRLLLTHNPNLNQWAGGILSFEHIGPHSMVVLKDVFWESTSWDAMNHGAPYLDTIMVGFVIIGVVSTLLLSKSQLPTFERKWVWISLLSFFGSVVLSALGQDYPGVRRIFSSLPLLFLIAGFGVKYLWRWRVIRPFLTVGIIVCFGLVTLRSYVISQMDWPGFRYWTRQPDFMIGARQTLLETTNSQKNVVLIAYHSDGYRAQQYRCALSLDEHVNQYFQTVMVIPREQLNQEQNFLGEFILLANELFSENQLRDTFGRPPSSSRIRRPSTSPRPDELVAIYEFTGDLKR